ncbi:DUF2492 family protein [Gilliamella mensalis]|uniref:DUF2492 family protein n=1 Tax=Gilliamella mensalis TaxID=1908520 RepID=UPI000A156791|nr:DUF2492 family protein [Gilliamella mensalis]
MSIHRHAVLHRMNKNNYTESYLLETINTKFSNNATFQACSQSNIKTKQLIDFLNKE